MGFLNIYESENVQHSVTKAAMVNYDGIFNLRKMLGKNWFTGKHYSHIFQFVIFLIFFLVTTKFISGVLLEKVVGHSFPFDFFFDKS